MYYFCNDGRALPPGNHYGKLGSGGLGSPVGCLCGERQGLDCLTFPPAPTQAWPPCWQWGSPGFPRVSSSLCQEWPWVAVNTFLPPGPGRALDLRL